MSVNQGSLQQSIRDITSTSLDYNGDWHALFDFYEIPDGFFNERMVGFLQACLSSTEANLDNLKNAYCASVGIYNWNSLTDISNLLPPSGNPNLLVGDNSDFAGGTTGDWIPTNATQQVLTTDPPAGFTHYLRTTATINNAGFSKIDNIIVEPSQTYRYSGYTRIFADATPSQRSRVTSGVTFYDLDFTNTSWQFFSYDFTITPSTQLDIFMFAQVSSNGTIGDWLDMTGLSLVKV